MKASLARGAQQANRWRDDEEMRWAVRHWATRIGVKAPQIRFQALKTQWATIAGGRMTLHPELLALPKDLGEFVIVHELLHQLVPNHGKVFKLFLDAYLPGWEEKERQLQAYTVAGSNGIL
jgi:predicted metal-dependent hydrolase